MVDTPNYVVHLVSLIGNACALKPVCNCYAKVTELGDTAACHEDVAGLQVSVDDTQAMDVLQRMCNLHEHPQHRCLREASLSERYVCPGPQLLPMPHNCL
mmetsp:Transcript_44443/g.102727  ORF Transcript_44443/g.102727 Transcript_44443/m.102727 type:complete len:100 (-) Transcript_44443:438-737(-)